MKKTKILSERLFLRAPNIHVCFMIRLEGNFTDEYFKEVVKMVCQRHPVLECTINIDEENCAWLIPNTGHVGIEFYHADEGLTWNDWYTKTDNIPFDFSHGPLVKICVIRHDKLTEIIVLGHHIIGDGMGYLNLAKDILAALDGKLDITPHIPPLQNDLKDNIRLGFLPRLVAGKLNKAWALSRHAFSEEDYYTLFEQHRTMFPPGMYTDFIEGTELSSLLAICKSNRLTVNEVIASAFVGAMLELRHIYPKNTIDLGIAINIRDDFNTPQPDSMGDYVSGINVCTFYDNKKCFIDNAGHIAKGTRKKLNNIKSRLLAVNFLKKIDKDFIESTQFAAYGNYQNPVSKKLCNMIGSINKRGKGVGISNLGRRNFRQYNSFKLLDILFVPPVFPYNMVTVGIITTNNKLNFVLRYAKSEISDDVAETVYRKAKGLLCTK
jgi:NRPS condensation-like uncharacterized protein